MILYGVSIGAAIYELLLPSTCNVYIIHYALVHLNLYVVLIWVVIYELFLSSTCNHIVSAHMILYGVPIAVAIIELLFLPSTCNVYIIHNALIARLSGMGAKELLV